MMLLALAVVLLVVPVAEATPSTNVVVKRYGYPTVVTEGSAPHPASTDWSGGERPGVRVRLASGVIDLFDSASVSVSGITARWAEVRLLGATDRAGSAYMWTPYRWRRLRRLHGTWRGLLPAPALFGIYQLQVRLDHGRKLLSSARWLLRVFPRGTVTRRTFPTPAAAVRDFVTHLPGDEVLKALRRWPQASFDHRNARLHRLFVVAYEPWSDNRPGSRLGLFITTVRDGFHGRWRLLEAAIEPYD